MIDIEQYLTFLPHCGQVDLFKSFFSLVFKVTVVPKVSSKLSESYYDICSQAALCSVPPHRLPPSSPRLTKKKLATLPWDFVILFLGDYKNLRSEVEARSFAAGFQSPEGQENCSKNRKRHANLFMVQ